MDKLFLIQLITSFLIGGFFIALLSFMAERASEKTAGMIISFPSTVAISFFFIGWALSPEKVAEIAPVVPVMSGVVMMFAATYLYISKIKMKKLTSMILCTIGGLSIWFIFAIPLAIIKLSNLFVSLIGYILLAGIAYYLLTVKSRQKSLHVPLKYTFAQKIGRAIFAGLIIALAIFLSKALGPFWGGVFSMFPAVFLSSLLIMHWHYDSSFLFKIWKNSPLGSIIFVIYPITAIYTFPALGIWWGTIVSYIICSIVFVIFTKLHILNNAEID